MLQDIYGLDLKENTIFKASKSTHNDVHQIP